MKKDNAGFSLIELIIAFALLAVVSAILLSFMVSGSNMYRNVSTEFALQMQSQTVMAQIKEYVVDCNGAIYFASDADGATLTVRNSDIDHDFVMDADNQTITYNDDLLATNVSRFYVHNSSGGAVQIEVTFEKNGKFYETTQVIALRNELVSLNSGAAPDIP